MSPKLSVFFIPQLWTDTLYGDLENAISLSWKCDQQFFFFISTRILALSFVSKVDLCDACQIISWLVNYVVLSISALGFLGL